MLTHTATSAASPAQVWTVLSDLAQWPARLPTVDALTPLDGPEPAVGRRYRLRQPGLATATWRVTRWEPGRGFTWVSRMTGVTTTATHDLTPTGGGGTSISLGIAWDGPLAGLVRRSFSTLTQEYLATEATTFTALAGDR
jgi:hypothetical protein